MDIPFFLLENIKRRVKSSGTSPAVRSISIREDMAWLRDSHPMLRHQSSKERIC